jgi:hypothetical protein
MKPLLILIVSFLIVVGWMTFFNHALNFPYAGRIAMAVMLIFTFIGHIKYADGMRLMLPSSFHIANGSSILQVPWNFLLPLD